MLPEVCKKMIIDYGEKTNKSAKFRYEQHRGQSKSPLTLLLVGEGGRIGPPASFSTFYGKRLKIGT